VLDSLGEDADSPVPNITHRYPDRALFLVSPVCASYCRFCTRRRKVGDPEKIPMSQYESAFQYLEQHTEIRDVILSGGDPLMLSDRRLDAILARLRKIPHLEVVRIGSRVPCHLPERITPELCATLKRHHPLYINTHFNHPDELTPAAVKGLAMLADAGIPLGCQTVLLRGVNDDVDVMRKLMQKLLAARVRPYYIYMCDNVAGVEHFKTTVEKGLEIVEGLRGWTSGLAVPHFVIDAPGGGGKIPLLPEYVVRLTDDEIVMRNFRGERYVWKQPQREAEEVAATGTDGTVLPIRGKGGKPKKKRAVRKTN
jgi:lysine 2,3-aminomutase